MINAGEKLSQLDCKVTFVHLNCSEEVESRSELDFVSHCRTNQIGMDKSYTFGLSRFRRVFDRLRWLRRTIKDLKPDTIITTGQWESSSWLMLACLGLPINLSVIVYGSVFSFSNDNDITKFAGVFRQAYRRIIKDYESFEHISLEAYEKLSFKRRLLNNAESYLRYWANRKARRIFALTGRVAREVEAMYGREVKPLPLSITETDDVVKKGECKPSELKMVYFGRLIKSKRVIEAIKIFEHLAEQVDGLVFHILGSGVERPAIEAYVAQSRFKDAIKVFGFVAEEVLKHEIETCLCTINLDIADFDLTTLESLGMGKPVVVSKICDLDKQLFDMGALLSEAEVLALQGGQLLDRLKAVDGAEVVSVVHANYMVDERVLQLVD